MIFNVIIAGLITALQGIAFLIPNIPNTPDSLIAVSDQIAFMVASSLSMLGMIFTPPLVIAVAFVTLTVISWTTIYYSISWIWKKIPLLNNIKL